MISLLVLENPAINRLLKDPRAPVEFPFLQVAANDMSKINEAKCKPCAKQKAANSKINYEAIKTAIAYMSPERKAVLKQILGAAQVRLIYVGVKGKLVRLTF